MAPLNWDVSKKEVYGIYQGLKAEGSRHKVK
jgi:hypothetical protein